MKLSIKQWLQIGVFAVVTVAVANLVGNKSERAEKVEQQIEQGYSNPSRNIK